MNELQLDHPGSGGKRYSPDSRSLQPRDSGSDCHFGGAAQKHGRDAPMVSPKIPSVRCAGGRGQR